MTNPKVPEISAQLTEKGLTLVVDGEPFVLSESHVSYTRVLGLLQDGSDQALSRIPAMLDINKVVSDFSDGRVEIIGGVVHFDKGPIHNALCDRMIKMLRLGMDVKPLSRFLENLMNNPSHHSVEQLYKFVDACDLPITSDGKLLVYRSVRSDFWDQHTGKSAYCKPAEMLTAEDLEMFTERRGDTRYMVNNGVRTEIYNGKTSVSMARNKVNDNHNESCSNGLHVCSQSYGKFSSILLLVSVDPADVVSVPNDYNAAKMRVCRFTVEKIVEGFETFKDTPVYDTKGSNESDFEYDIF